MERKPFAYDRYWTSFIFSSAGYSYAAPLVDPLLDGLPNDARDLTVLELGAGNGAAAGVFAATPSVAKVYALDPAIASAELITASLQGMVAYKAAGNHFADIQPLTMRIEDMTPENTPRADILYACGTWMYVEQDLLEPQLAMILSVQPNGNRMVSNFATPLGAAQAIQQCDDLPPIACIAPNALRAILDANDYKGEIEYADAGGQPVPPEEAIMLVVRAQKGGVLAAS